MTYFFFSSDFFVMIRLEREVFFNVEIFIQRRDFKKQYIQTSIYIAYSIYKRFWFLTKYLKWINFEDYGSCSNYTSSYAPKSPLRVLEWRGGGKSTLEFKFWSYKFWEGYCTLSKMVINLPWTYHEEALL